MIITLIGYRGSGKSSVAVPLSESLHWDWIDADTEIERTAGCSIREIFENEGEIVFRQMERKVIQELLQKDRLVLAAGGGAILDEQTRLDFQNAGPVVWLQASLTTLSDRLTKDEQTSETRPSLTGSGTVSEIETVLRQREPIYQETASIIVETDGLTISQIVEEIQKQLKLWGRERVLDES